MIRIALLLLLVMCGVAQAQSVPAICQPHGVVKEKLERQYGEVLVAMGLAGTALFEVYASEAGTFTVLLTRPEMRGLSCIQGAGQDFILTGNEYPKVKKGSPS
jgi:hypothetical protein|tara:strand:+ start:1620 stop:1928 length:309 start_codon:yes stop_codon:yes gene_type:complete